MLRLNRLTDYGMVVLVALARTDGVMSAQRLSEQTGLPQPTVAKLLAMLARHGFAAARRGVNGGYALGNSADAISVADIIEALEGPVALTACVEGGERLCDRERICAVRGHWDKVNGAIRRALGSVTLAEMARIEHFERLYAAEPPAGRPDSGTKTIERVTS